MMTTDTFDDFGYAKGNQERLSRIWSIFIIIIVFNADGLAELRDQRRGG